MAMAVTVGMWSTRTAKDKLVKDERDHDPVVPEHVSSGADMGPATLPRLCSAASGPLP